MADKTVFTEAVDLLATDPANVQAAQLLHIMVTGGPAPTGSPPALPQRDDPRGGQNSPYIPLNVSVLSPLPFKGYS